jgi:hypothetical protein
MLPESLFGVDQRRVWRAAEVVVQYPTAGAVSDASVDSSLRRSLYRVRASTLRCTSIGCRAAQPRKVDSRVVMALGRDARVFWVLVYDLILEEVLSPPWGLVTSESESQSSRACLHRLVEHRMWCITD